MSSNDHSARIHKKPAKALLNLYSLFLKEGEDLMESLLEKGIIDIGRLNEVVDSHVHGLKLESGEGRDLSDGSDCKFATVNHRFDIQKRHGKAKAYSSYQASATVKNKTGDIRMRIYNPVTNTWYYGVIPNSAFKGVSSINVRFGNEGKEMKSKFKKYFKKSIV